MLIFTIKGRNRRQAVLDDNGDPVITYDTTPMTVRVADARSLKHHSHSLLVELHDAPGATIEHEGDVKSLKDFLRECGHAVDPEAPKASPVQSITEESK